MKIKKILAVVMATAALATSALSLPASAALKGTTNTRPFAVGNGIAYASVSLGYTGNNYYGASTSSNDSSITDRWVNLLGYASDGSTVSNSSSSYSGTAATSVYAPHNCTFTGGTSTHSAKNGTVSGGTTMYF